MLAERTRALSAALATITDDQRTAIVLFDVEGYDYAEIAEMTGVSLGHGEVAHPSRPARPAGPPGRPHGAVPWLTGPADHATHDLEAIAALADDRSPEGEAAAQPRPPGAPTARRCSTTCACWPRRRRRSPCRPGRATFAWIRPMPRA